MSQAERENLQVAKSNRGLCFWGQVSEVMSPTQFKCSNLAVFGDGYFFDYDIVVLKKFDGSVTPPKSEVQRVTAYTSVGGIFTHAAFTAGLSVGDEVAFLMFFPLDGFISDVADIKSLVEITQGFIYYGVVTGVPGANQFTIPDLAGLGAGKFGSVTPEYAYQAFVLRDAAGGSAAPQGESQPVTGYATGTGNFSAGAFTVPVAIGDEILIIHPFLGRLTKFSGAPGTNGNLVGNWNAAEATVCTIGAPNTRYKVHNLTIGIGALVGNITIRLYSDVNGLEQCIYPIPAATTFDVATDQTAIPIIPLIMSSFGIKNALRVTVQSDNPADDGAIVEYDYLIEAM
jgi:hypothetical protein